MSRTIRNNTGFAVYKDPKQQLLNAVFWKNNIKWRIQRYQIYKESSKGFPFPARFGTNTKARRDEVLALRAKKQESQISSEVGCLRRDETWK